MVYHDSEVKYSAWSNICAIPKIPLMWQEGSQIPLLLDQTLIEGRISGSSLGSSVPNVRELGKYGRGAGDERPHEERPSEDAEELA